MQCKQCNQQFVSLRKSKKFCSRICLKRSYREIRYCNFCNRDYECYRYNGTRYCSNSCHTKSQAKPENHCVRECVACKTKFETLTHCKPTHQFCSRSCSHQFTHNKSKWFQINGITCQGTWELSFLDWALNKQLHIKSERRPISYIDDKEKTRVYHPDFWIDEWKTYIDIKSLYTEKFSIRKFELLEQQGIHILVLSDVKLKELGVDLSYKHRLDLSKQFLFNKNNNEQKELLDEK